MSSFETAYNWLMDNEDARRAYATEPDYPPGAHAISGINSAAYPEEFSAINALPQSQRGPAVEQFYQKNFWNKWYEQLDTDDVANRVFDSAVNQGPGTAVKLLQTAINVVNEEWGGAEVAVDGGLGPQTVQVANACNPATLVNAFQRMRVAKYQASADANPALRPYLAGWIARALK